MKRVRMIRFRLRALALLGPLAIVAVIGLLTSASAQEFRNPPSAWEDVYLINRDALLELPKSIKVGAGYTFEKSTPYLELKWGLRWIYSPVEATAQRKFYIYSFSDILDIWPELSQELSGRDPLVAFVDRDPEAEKYYGVPVKWNGNLISFLNIAHTRGDEGREMALRNASHALVAGLFFGLNGIESTNIAMAEKAFQVRPSNIIDGDIYQFSETDIDNFYPLNEVENRIYFAIDVNPRVMRSKNTTLIDTVLTRSGAFGQILGTQMSAWAFEHCEFESKALNCALSQN